MSIVIYAPGADELAARIMPAAQRQALNPVHPPRLPIGPWALTRAPAAAARRIPAPRPPNGLEAAAQPMTIGLRHTPNSTVTRTARVPYPYSLDEISWTVNSASNGPVTVNVASAYAGPIWQNDNDSPSIGTAAAAARGVPTQQSYHPGTRVHAAGDVLTLTLTSGDAVDDAYLSVTVRPLTPPPAPMPAA